MEHFDVAIIGLGPAGSALARKLAGKMQVIALDKKHQCGTEGFSKPCRFSASKLSTSPHRSRVTTSEAISILIAMLSTCG